MDLAKGISKGVAGAGAAAYPSTWQRYKLSVLEAKYSRWCAAMDEDFRVGANTILRDLFGAQAANEVMARWPGSGAMANARPSKIPRVESEVIDMDSDEDD